MRALLALATIAWLAPCLPAHSAALPDTDDTLVAATSQSDTDSNSGGESGHQCERRRETPTS
ncbi:MAG: hypothetical protein LJE67_02320 [Salaquimonas sp.]|jgi:hypothetical protein|nr:hypothetical protein [Salaquimonas sp.]